MPYLEYHTKTRLVVEIHETEPKPRQGYTYVESNTFNVGDEFEYSIWVNLTEDNEVKSYSLVWSNPHAKRLLEENSQLKKEVEHLRLEAARSNTELFEAMLAMTGGV